MNPKDNIRETSKPMSNVGHHQADKPWQFSRSDFKIHILKYTQSMSITNTYNKFTSPLQSQRKNLKINNYLIKIKSRNNDIHNDFADHLAAASSHQRKIPHTPYPA